MIGVRKNWDGLNVLAKTKRDGEKQLKEYLRIRRRI